LKKTVPIVVVAVVVALVVLNYGSHVDDPRELFYSGVVEARQYDLAFELPGSLAEMRVEDGAAVKKGDVLALLDKRETEKRWLAAQAQLAASQARLEELQNGSRAEDIEAAEARVAEAAAEVERLENGPTAQELARVFHQKESARQQALLKKNGYRDEDVEQARARLEGSKADLVAARLDLDRYQALLDEGAAPQAVVDEKRRRYETAQAQVRERTEALEELREGFRSEEVAASEEQFLAAQAQFQDLQNGTRPELVDGAVARLQRVQAEAEKLRNGTRPEALEAARESVKQLEAEGARLQVVLDKMELRSPVDGIVSARSFEAGETVAAGTAVVQVTARSDIWVNIFLPETELGRVPLGASCEVTADSLSAALQGEVTYISPTAEFTPRFVQTERERVMLVYRAEVKVDNPDGALKPGMPADVQVLKP